MGDSSLDITIRPAQPQDREAIAAVVNSHSLDVLGTKRALIDQHDQLRFARYVPANAERVVAVAGDGQVIGFQYLVSQPPYLVHELGGAVHAAYRGRGIGTQLLDWAERRAREQLPQAPAATNVVAQSHMFANDQHARALLANAGYRRVREWIHLAIEMTEPPPAPIWPDGISVRVMDQNRDWPIVGDALEEAFVDHWGQIPPAALPQAEDDPDAESDDEEDEGDEDDPYSNSRDFCFVALCGGEVSGSCLGNAKTIEWPDSGKVGSLSIRRPYRRRGLARAMMYHALGEFYRHGTRRVITDTDDDSFTGANRLYQQIGMRIYRREHLYEKVLRPGTELRLLTPA
jgi:ribosomal protein S18 acetylase RimI-like enzyme